MHDVRAFEDSVSTLLAKLDTWAVKVILKVKRLVNALDEVELA
jgi:hypothetical protein